MMRSEETILCDECEKELVLREQPYDYTELAGLNPREYTVLLNGIRVYECACGLTPEIPNIEGLHYMLCTALVTDSSPIQPSGYVFLRKALAMTQVEFAKLGDIRPEYLSAVERGKRHLSTATEALIRLRVLSRLLETPGIRNHFGPGNLEKAILGLAALSEKVIRRLQSERIEIECPPAWMIKGFGDCSGSGRALR